jgi:UDP-2,4-diacetamido-2,4,6-trideoxy-beta-L-altropyranose hydrolase
MLANGLAAAGWDCIFLVNDEAQKVLPRLFASQHDVRKLDEDARLSASAVKDCGRGDLLVVDHYELGRDFEDAVRDAFRLVMAIDDFPRRKHRCDILLNQNIEPSDPEILHGGATHELFGRQYALLDPRYSALRSEVLPRRKKTDAVERLLICFGASDPNDYCGRAVSAIRGAGFDLAIDIAVSSASPNAGVLLELADLAGSGVTLHLDAENMPDLMARADLAIGAAGVTTWERCCLGLPSIVYQCADNQARIAGAVAEQAAGSVLGEAETMTDDTLVRAFKALCADPDARAAMSDRAARMVDGCGVAKVVGKIEMLRGGTA